MGSNLSQSIDFEKNLYIIFDSYPVINYSNGKDSNLLEKNAYYKKYIKHKIIKSFQTISNVKIIIPDSRFIIQNKINDKDKIIYYQINIRIEFNNREDTKNMNSIDIPLSSSLMSIINIENIYNNKTIKFELLEKTIRNVFMMDVINNKKIKIDKDNYIDLTGNNNFIQNIEIYHDI
jgi:hypothetical protein